MKTLGLQTMLVFSFVHIGLFLDENKDDPLKIETKSYEFYR